MSFMKIYYSILEDFNPVPTCRTEGFYVIDVCYIGNSFNANLLIDRTNNLKIKIFSYNLFVHDYFIWHGTRRDFINIIFNKNYDRLSTWIIITNLFKFVCSFEISKKYGLK